jgi:amidophosphoribosyltransferase
MVVVDGAGVRSIRAFPDERIDPKLCVFEFVYFARPDSRLYGRSVHHARVRQGELLAEQAPVEADMVMGVPESGIPDAEG